MGATDPFSSPLLPAQSLAHRLGVEKSWLLEEAAAGRIPGVPAGRTYLFDPEAVVEALLERARERTAPDGSTSRDEGGASVRVRWIHPA